MKAITAQVIAEVRTKASILDVVSQFVVLKRQGKEHKGLCPFHAEKTPSFHVNPEKGIYKCFGCGEGGDVFAFLQKIKGQDFLDVVRDLALTYGVKLSETKEERREYDKRLNMLMLYQQACEYYMHLLWDPKAGVLARRYLNERGITDEVCKRFKLGYATASTDGVSRYLIETTAVSPETLMEAGLIRRRPDSYSYFDLFRSRLIIPIFDDQGRVIAFGGRTLQDDQIKYLNSPETPIYTKGQHLFGFHLAKDAIKEKDFVVVVEGYFDVITAHQYGFTNTVATLGTALTEKQARLLVRYTDGKRVYLGFDADAAGLRAVDKGVETLNQIAEGIGIELRVIRLPESKDPDDCLRVKGAYAFEKAISEAPLLIDHQLDLASSSAKTQSHMGRIEAATKIVPILAQIKNAVGRGEYIRQWACKLGIREDELLSDVRRFRQENKAHVSSLTPGKGPSHQAATKLGVGARRDAPRGGSRAAPTNGYIEAERQILALYLLSYESYVTVRDAMAEERLISKPYQRIKESIEGIGSQFSTLEDLRVKLMDRLAPEPQSSACLIEVILKAEELNKQKVPVDVVLRDSRARLLKEKLLMATAKMVSLLSSAENESVEKSLQSRIKQLSVLEKVDLASCTVLDDLDNVKRKIEEITGAFSLETTCEQGQR